MSNNYAENLSRGSASEGLLLGHHNASAVSLQSNERHSSFMAPDFHIPAPSHQTMIDKRNPLKLRIKRLNWKVDWSLYLRSPFHTLLNMPSSRFCVVFFMTYILHYVTFALLYLAFSDECVEGIHRFWHAFNFSVQTSATIGYGGELTPNPDCVGLNLLVTAQTVISLLLDYSMLGLLYARFSSPTLRAGSIRFSKSLCMEVVGDRLELSSYVVNVRSKNIINPSIRMLLAITDASEEEENDPRGEILHMMVMQCCLSKEADASLSLGLPAKIRHVIDDNSPLVALSPKEMARHNMEILLLVDGTDAMTSHTIQARHTYQAADIVLQDEDKECGLVRRLADGTITVDFSTFRFRAGGNLAQAALDATVHAKSEAMSSRSAASSPSPVSRPVDVDRTGLINKPSAFGSTEESGNHLAVDLADLNLDEVPDHTAQRQASQQMWDVSSSFMAIRQSLVENKQAASPLARPSMAPFRRSSTFTRGPSAFEDAQEDPAEYRQYGQATAAPSLRRWSRAPTEALSGLQSVMEDDVPQTTKDLRPARDAVLHLCALVLTDRDMDQEVKEAAILARSSVLEVMA